VDEPRPLEPVTASEGARLGRYRVLQVLSVAMILAGILLGAIAFVGNPGILSEEQTPESARRLLGALLLLGLGTLLLVSGLVMNATRAVIVRAALPPERYRGPAVFVLLLLALILGNLVGLGAAGDAIKLVAGGQLTVGGTLVLVTAIQAGMLIVVGGLVVLPRALAGLHLAPRRSLWRDVLIGLGVAIPAWIAATLISALIALILQAVGLAPGPELVDRVVDRGEPTALLIGFVVVAPIAEELFFRGVVFNAWERERGTRVAVYGSALLFAAIHGAVLFVPVLFLGVVLAHLYRVTRSLPATMAVHACFNAISLTLALLVRLRILDLPI